MSSYVAIAGVVPASTREPLLKETLKVFWSKGKTADGKSIQPTSNSDRQTMPVNMNVANFAFDMGELSGLAEWCGVDWRENFAALTRQARKNNQTEKQVAFISIVHGTAQGFVASSMAKSGSCSAQQREQIKSQIDSMLAHEPR
ncbi:MAG: hypothetical protein PHQ90_04790 [Sulfuricurvum sp.]|uniref:hypothetical protein n=1 Tax=Sulfuricurvum sp. TaxID=2025608 RepID=UPI002623911E|nr:hypothetical protein [Sulfuricurvum sp.]MDD2368598.1 hypothetical protein [Sulfuricurvum sp.]MDD5118133.1 hypothetical protein [Sulfuricurvum sp.]